MGWAWDDANEILTVTGGTAASPITLDDFDGGVGETRVIVPMTAAAQNITPSKQPIVGSRLAVTLNLNVTGTPDATDQVTINGTDAWGNAISETIDVPSADWYETTKYFATVTDVDCTTVGSYSIKLYQVPIYPITKPTDGVYLVGCNLEIGDGTAATFLKSAREVVRFAPGATLEIADNATLQLGERYPDDATGWGRNGAMWSINPSANMTIIGSGAGSAVLSLYSSTLRIDGNYTYSFNAGTIHARNAIVAGTRDVNSGCTLQFSSAVTLDWKRVQYVNWGWFRLNGTTLANFEDVHSHANYSGIRAGYANQEVYRLRITKAEWREVYYYAAAPGRKLTILNPVNRVSSLFIQDDDGTVEEVYTCNIHVVDKDGNGLAGVRVVCRDKDSNTAFDVTTDANGEIAEQRIVYKDWVGTAETETAYGPHTFTFSKDGYQTLVMENVTVDRPIEWRVELQPPGGGGGEKAVNLGMQT